MSNLKPGNIENVSVLRGKDATQAYGEKGKNGVIIVTSKTDTPTSNEGNDNTSKMSSNPWRVSTKVEVINDDEDDDSTTPLKSHSTSIINKNTERQEP